MKLKNENVYILKCKNEKYPERRVEIQARTTEYKGHKFIIQGNCHNGYFISDFETGMLFTTFYSTLKGIKEDFEMLADKFINNIVSHTDFYMGALDRFNKAPIIKEED